MKHTNCRYLLATIGALAFPSAALGQDSAARVLAQDGKALVDAGNLDQGCPKLEEALKMDSQLLGAAFTLGECYEKQGKLASAWSTYASVAGKAAARGEARAAQAQAKAEALKPRLSTITVRVSPQVAQAAGVEITIGGKAIAKSLFGTPIPKDGGKLEIAVNATGRAPWLHTVDVPTEGKALEVVAELGQVRDGEAPPPKTPDDATAPQPPGGAQNDSTFWKPLHIGGAAVTALGAVGLGLGATFGVLAMQKRDESDDTGGCDPDNNFCTTQAGVDLRAESLVFGDVATAMFVVGGVAAAAGIVMLAVPLSDGAPAPATARVWIGPTGVNFEARFQ